MPPREKQWRHFNSKVRNVAHCTGCKKWNPILLFLLFLLFLHFKIKNKSLSVSVSSSIEEKVLMDSMSHKRRRRRRRFIEKRIHFNYKNRPWDFGGSDFPLLPPQLLDRLVAVFISGQPNLSLFLLLTVANENNFQYVRIKILACSNCGDRERKNHEFHRDCTYVQTSLSCALLFLFSHFLWVP